MCNYRSFVVGGNSAAPRVEFVPGVDSHRKQRERLGIGQGDYHALVEVWPPAADGTTTQFHKISAARAIDYRNWKFVLDTNREPSWWKDASGPAEAEIERIIMRSVLREDSKTPVSGELLIVGGCHSVFSCGRHRSRVVIPEDAEECSIFADSGVDVLCYSRRAKIRIDNGASFTGVCGDLSASDSNFCVLDHNSVEALRIEIYAERCVGDIRCNVVGSGTFDDCRLNMNPQDTHPKYNVSINSSDPKQFNMTMVDTLLRIGRSQCKLKIDGKRSFLMATDDVRNVFANTENIMIASVQPGHGRVLPWAPISSGINDPAWAKRMGAKLTKLAPHMAELVRAEKAQARAAERAAAAKAKQAARAAERAAAEAAKGVGAAAARAAAAIRPVAKAIEAAGESLSRLEKQAGGKRFKVKARAPRRRRS